MVGKLNRDMEIRKMVTDSELVEDQDVDLPEGASLVPKMASEEKLREAKHKRMEANLEPIEELEDADGTGEDSD
ncbi:hypothetical protein [Halegenticoccus soli]|uniref:hypothetical protein n=1 Tax=Halegenticoccus soli TaxID=1985678 RepID=UPI0018EDEE17|nr:hypothetical protein [Halegenticoccus soli]